MIGLAVLAIGLASQWFLGIAIAAMVFSLGPQKPVSRAEWIGLGFVLGISGTSWLLLIWSLCGGPLGPIPSLLLTLIGFACGVPALLRQKREMNASQTHIVHAPPSQRAFSQFCQAGIAIILIASFARTFLTPQKLWDERAIFAIKARVMFEDRSLTSAALMHPDFVQYHPRYPLLLPLAEEHIYALLGTVDDRLSKIVFCMLNWGLILTFSGVLQRQIATSQAWLGAFVLASAPVLIPYEYGFACGQADAPVACFHGLSTLYLWNALAHRGDERGNFSSVVLAAVFSASAAFTKDEGIAYLIIDTAILGLFAAGCVFHPSRFRQSLLTSAIFAGISSLLLLPWLVHRRHLPNTTEMNYFGRMSVTLFLSRLDTLKWSVPHLVRRMFWEWREWGLQWCLTLAAIIAFPTRVFRRPQLFLLLDVVGAVGSLLAAGMLAPAQLDEHIGGSSHRFLMQIAPVAILFVVATYFDADSSSQRNPDALAQQA